MGYSNYTQIEQALKECAEFQGNSCFGQWVGDTYIVTSYWTTIAKAVPSPGGLVFWVNPEKYSQTTSKLQNIIKRAWGVK